MNRSRFARFFGCAFGSVLFAGCCFGGANGGGLGGGGLGGGGATVATGPVTSLGPGFQPDPTLLTGTAGGPIDASTASANCRGFTSLAPSHTLSITVPMMLRILARSDQDTTLVVRSADGTYVCNDDFEGSDPAVDVTFPAGQHSIWVGTYSAGASAPYTLGITTNPTLQPSTMTTSQPFAGGGGPTVGTMPSAPAGTIRLSGTAIVALVSGNVPGVTAGSTCTYTQTTSDPATSGFDCRWRVECSGVVVYGDGDGGFAPCSDPAWPPGTLVADTETTSGDRDASLVINPGGLSARDDAMGPRGEYSVTATIAPMPPG